MTVADILAQSSNVGTIKIAHDARQGALRPLPRRVRLRAADRARPPRRVAGLARSPLTNYNDTSMGSMPIGNGIAVTAMQMLDVYTTIANDGMARPPRLVAATIDADGKRHDEPLAARRTRSCRRRPPTRSPACSSRRRRPAAPARRPQVAGYPVAGKTGTARKAPYDTGEYNAVVRRVRAGRQPPARGDRRARRARRAASSAATSPRRCSRRSCSTRSPTSGCRPHRERGEP